MARGFSKAIITGNLTRDPEVRTTPNGANVATFTVAVNRNFRDSSGNPQESVSFIDCSAWNGAATVIGQYAHKGSGILVSGRLEQHSWEDKATGQKRSRIEIVVEDFNFLGGIDRDGGSSFGGETAFGSDGGSAGASYGAGDNAGGAAGADIVPEDIAADDEINLNEIPF